MQIEYRNVLTVKDFNMLRASAGWSTIEESQATVSIRNSAFIIAATDENRTVGCARLVSDGGYTAIIVDVLVLPEYRGNGIGKTMMTHIMSYISGHLKEGQCVMVNLMAAKGRESFYTQFGFAERPDEKYGAGMVQYIRKP